jgi:GAF domain-containing protein
MNGDALSERLAAMARDLRAEPDAEHTLDHIVRLAAAWVGGDDTQAAITLVHRKSEVETVASTSALARHGDELQYELHEGPCLDAAWEHELVYAGDLAHDDRWPTWGPRVAKELHVGSMLCVRLFTHQMTLGALNLYSGDRHAFDKQARAEAEAIAAQAAVALAAARQIEQLEIAVGHRTNIGKALGILMERFDVDDVRALSILQRVSSTENRKLYDIALELLKTRQLPPHHT